MSSGYGFLILWCAATKVALISLLLGIAIASSCTMSLNVVHTQGSASDVVDDTQTASPDVKADVSIPASLTTNEPVYKEEDPEEDCKSFV